MEVNIFDDLQAIHSMDILSDKLVYSKAANSPTEKPKEDVTYELPSYLLWLQSGKDDFLEYVVWCGSKGPLEPV